MAKTIAIWNRVFLNEEGLKCLFAAKDNPEKIIACKANGAGALTVNFLLGVGLATLLLVRAG